MADRIDLDEIDVEEPDEESAANHGDWLWRGEGDPADEPEPAWSSGSDSTGVEDADFEPESPGDDDPTSVGPDGPVPGVPRESTGTVGVPESGGGAGAGTPSNRDSSELPEPSPQRAEHGGTEPNGMTLAFTYEALNRLSDPGFVVTDARGWADWIGVVGKVSTPAIKGFQRRERLEIDFFGGSEEGPEKRLVDVTPESMFYAERMVLVGAENDEPIAEAAGWEFVPLAEAAEKAGWTIEHAE
jgi:hypothetical protein